MRSTLSRGVRKRQIPPVCAASRDRKRSWLALPMPRQCTRAPLARALARTVSVANTCPSVRIRTSPGSPPSSFAAASTPAASSVPPRDPMASRNARAALLFSVVPSTSLRSKLSTLLSNATTPKRSSGARAARQAWIAFLAWAIGAPPMEPERSSSTTIRRAATGAVPNRWEGMTAATRTLPSRPTPESTCAPFDLPRTSSTRSRSGRSLSLANITRRCSGSSRCTLTE